MNITSLIKSFLDFVVMKLYLNSSLCITPPLQKMKTQKSNKLL